MNAGGDLRRDLVVLVPDETFRAVVAILLSRHESLKIRRISLDIYAHAYHDPGCLRQSVSFLTEFLPTHARAIVLFDRKGCGREDASAPELENALRDELRHSGWEERAEVVVLDPELEAWVWSESPQVERCLGWAGRRPALREWLEHNRLWEEGSPKPSDPKSAVDLALRETRTGPRRPVLVELARSVGLRRCRDRAFLRFREILQRWFPAP